MDFTVINSSNSSFEVDQTLAKKDLRKEFNGQVGISVISEYVAYELDTLTIATQINFIAIAPPGILDVAKSLFLTHFHMQSTKTLRAGINEQAVALMQKMTDLAEAQSYSIFNILSNQAGLPQSGMELTPVENYMEDILAFLQEFQLPVQP